MKPAALVFVFVQFALIFAAKEFRTLDHLKSKVSWQDQTTAAQELIKRVIPDRAGDFIARVDPGIGPKNRDTYNIIATSTKVTITGTTGVAVAMGLYYYLSYYCGCQKTWAGQQLNIPTSLPVIASPGVTMTTNDRFRYYQNVCTVSYSFAFFNWTDWENQIDWMALRGINLPLAFTGQEAIFQRLYMKMGFTMEELQNHFGGPAFLAWSRMGNMRGVGGPLPQTWIDDQLVLQHKILDRVRSLGMIPVLPAFAGHVPQNITRLYPNVKVSRLPDWGRFKDKYCCTYLLDFEDPLFIAIGAKFIQEMQAEFGVNHIYNCDTFNELPPKTSATAYINMAGSKVYEAMIAGDPQAIWLMQGWLFQEPFWQPPQTKALLNSVPQGKMIVLDLGAEIVPVFQRTESFYGQPFIWCMIHNFGGTLELYGALDRINTAPLAARNFTNSTMIGIGMTPEGIFQNEVIYEFMAENAWRKAPRNVTQWIADFSARRYGKTNSYAVKAWQTLQVSVFNDKRLYYDLSTNVIPTTRPRITPLVKQQVWYNPKDLYAAWSYMLQAASDFPNNKLFLYDLVDITRNSLQIISMKYYSEVVENYYTKKTAALADVGMNFTRLISDMETILASDEHFLLGKWVKAAQDLAKDVNEVILYTYNARNQITLWGPNGEVRDYASKQWSGLVGHYYLKRWQMFVDTLVQSLYNNTAFNQEAFEARIFNEIELPFQHNAPDFPLTPTGDSVAISKSLYTRYKPDMGSEFFTKLYKESFSMTPDIRTWPYNRYGWSRSRTNENF